MIEKRVLDHWKAEALRGRAESWIVLELLEEIDRLQVSLGLERALANAAMQERNRWRDLLPDKSSALAEGQELPYNATYGRPAGEPATEGTINTGRAPERDQ